MATDQEKRQTTAFMYAGIAAGPPSDEGTFTVGGDQVIERFQPVKIVSAATTITPWDVKKKTGGTDGP